MLLLRKRNASYVAANNHEFVNNKMFKMRTIFGRIPRKYKISLSITRLSEGCKLKLKICKKRKKKFSKKSIKCWKRIDTTRSVKKGGAVASVLKNLSSTQRLEWHLVSIYSMAIVLWVGWAISYQNLIARIAEKNLLSVIEYFTFLVSKSK